MRSAKKKAPVAKKGEKSSFKSFLYTLRKKRIIEILAGFIGGGWLILEFVHWILIDHYHFPEESLDIAIVTLTCALICTLTWRIFAGVEKKARKVKLELILIPLIILITAFFDVRLIQQIGEPEAEVITQSRWKNSIAVLPFVNISAEEEQEYFCDGLTEELINRLSNIKELKVPSRTSSFAFKGEKIDIREVGQKLNVDKVLEGSVRKTENHIRITAKLINIADGYHLWSQKYDRNIEDVFAIQDEISLAIVDNLKINLLRDQKEKIVKRYTKDIEAYNIYLKGRFFWNKRTEEDLKKAIDYFKETIGLDPNYALGYIGLADSYLMLDAYTESTLKEAYLKAREAVLKALEIDSNLAEARTSLAWIKMEYDWDWEGAEREFKRAIELNPGYVTAHRWYGQYLMYMARFDEAIEEIKHALELDPVSLVNNIAVGTVLYYARQYDRAIEAFQKTIEMDPNFSNTHFYLGKVYLQKSMYEEALTEFQKEKELSRRLSSILESWIGLTYVQMGKRSEAQDVLDNLIERKKKQGDIRTIIAAFFYFALGKHDQGFIALEKDIKERTFSPWRLKISPVYNSVRSDPRFIALLKKVGLE